MQKLEEYNKKKQEAKATRNLFLSKIIDYSSQIEKTIKSLNECVSNLITWEEMKLIKLNKEFIIDNKIKLMKYYDSENEMKFTCYMKPNSFFNLHNHDFKEITTVMQGSLIEPTQQNKVLNKTDVIIYQKGLLHKPYTTEATVLDIVNRK